MAIPLQDLINNSGPPIFYREDFRRVIEDHLFNLRNSRNATERVVPPNIGYQFEFDFYGLLRSLSVPVYLHWITMRINGYTTPEEYQADHLSIIMPDTDMVERLRSVHNTITAPH